MASREEEKRARRAEREAREAEAAQSERRTRRLRLLGIAAAAVVVVVVGAIIISSSGSGDKGGKQAGPAEGAATVTSQFAGIPQKGLTIGNPNAPVTLVEFADLQCPFCKEAAAGSYPDIISKYVKAGKVKLEYRTFAILGDDSVTAAKAAVAAGQQGKAWDFIDLWYKNQGEENSGYVTDAFIKRIASGRARPRRHEGRRRVARQRHRRPPDREHRGVQVRRQLDADVPDREDRRDVEQGQPLRPEQPGRARGRHQRPDAVTDRRLRIAIGAIAALGVAIATYLVYVHYAGIEPICAAGGGGCHKVQTSEFAELAGIPVALLGLIGYILILGVAVRARRHGLLAGAVLALGGFGFSAVPHLPRAVHDPRDLPVVRGECGVDDGARCVDGVAGRAGVAGLGPLRVPCGTSLARPAGCDCG